MRLSQIITFLIVTLAVIAAIVATGLIAGFNMHAWIVGYWLVLTMKNLMDYADRTKSQ